MNFKRDVIKYVMSISIVLSLVYASLVNGFASNDDKISDVPVLHVSHHLDVEQEVVTSEETTEVTTLFETASSSENIIQEPVIIEEPIIYEEPIENEKDDPSIEKFIYKPSNLTIEEFNSLIEYTLNEKGKVNSKFSNLGEYLYKVEQDENINGLFILSIFTIESGYGVSNLALTDNNLGGLTNMSFDSPGECTLYAGKLMSNYYIGEGLITFEDISCKYCPPNHVNWARDVESTFNMYNDYYEIIMET